MRLGVESLGICSLVDVVVGNKNLNLISMEELFEANLEEEFPIK